MSTPGIYKYLRGEKNKRNVSDSRLAKYGLTHEKFNALFDFQNGLCRICQRELDKFAIDHNHTTGLVRGLLCVPCNTGLGYFRDNPARFDNAASYLRNTDGIHGELLKLRAEVREKIKVTIEESKELERLYIREIERLKAEPINGNGLSNVVALDAACKQLGNYRDWYRYTTEEIRFSQ